MTSTRFQCKDLATLNPGCWLNDEAINSYALLIDHASLPDILVLTSAFYWNIQKKAGNDGEPNPTKSLRSYLKVSVLGHQ